MALYNNNGQSMIVPGYPQGFYNNPYNNYQQRLNYMEQQQMQQVQPQAPMLKGMPVSDEQSARSAMIDFDGSVSIFPDYNNGYIYTKRLNLNDCTPVFEKYKLVKEADTKPEFVSREEFNGLNQQVQTVIAFLNGSVVNNATTKPNDVHTDVLAAEPTNAGPVATDTANGKRKNTRANTANGE